MNSTVNKRVLKDITDGTKNLKAEYGIYLAPEEDNYYNVHFVLPGPPDTPYEKGLYHGMIRLNKNHPFAPPNIYVMTPSGRFVPDSYPILPDNRGICVSFTAFHPESWSPSLNIESVLKGFISFMCDDKDGGMGSILTTPVEKRKQMAKDSYKHLVKEPIVQTLFPELCVEIANKTYVQFKMNTKQTIITTPKKKIEPSSKKKESSAEEEPIKKPKKKNTKNTSSSEEEPIKKPKKKNTKNTSSSEEEPIIKPKKKNTKDILSSEEEIIIKPKKKMVKKQLSSSESEENPLSKPKKKLSTKNKSKSKKVESISESETSSSEYETSSSSESEEDVKSKKKNKTVSKKHSKY
jgi:ubiquitin-conjugating enzyme E2 J2